MLSTAATGLESYPTRTAAHRKSKAKMNGLTRVFLILLRMDQAKDQAVRWLLGEQQKGGRDSTLVVEKSFNGAAVVKVKQTSRQRIDAYRANVEDLRRIMNEKLPAFGRDVEKQKIAPLKGETNRQRTELLAELEKPMEESLASVLTEEQKKLG